MVQRGPARVELACGACMQVGAQGVDAHIIGGIAVAGEHRRILQRRAYQQCSDLGLDLGHARGVHPVDLGERHCAAIHAQQLQDRQVLAGLWHHTVVGGNHQQRHVDAGSTGHHRMHEAFMAWHVDETQRRRRVSH